MALVARAFVNRQIWCKMEPQNNESIFDVIVVGGGIMGLSTAFNLQKAGKRCLLLEQYTIGHIHGRYSSFSRQSFTPEVPMVMDALFELRTSTTFIFKWGR